MCTEMVTLTFEMQSDVKVKLYLYGKATIVNGTNSYSNSVNVCHYLLLENEKKIDTRWW